ncbi:MAG: serine hydrolase [Bacteriovoracia bacterium]
MSFEIPYYHDYISPNLLKALLAEARAVKGVEGLAQVGEGGGLETEESLKFLVALYEEIKPTLAKVLRQRILDRKFIDERVTACHAFNESLRRDWLSPDYQTVLGLEDAKGRIVIGPKNKNYCRQGGAKVAPLPEFLMGPHVTLFGPPDSAKMAINAMNSYHRKLPTEPAIVAELLASSSAGSPMWGADDEDSKTPLRADLVDAAVNLTGCFEGTLSLSEGTKNYELAADHLALPIKRFPGLALPSNFLFYQANPLPLHLYDFALHLFRNWNNPRALVFYVPKLENEEEAAYIHLMIATAERMIQAQHHTYRPGSVRLMIVLENPRAILRAHEIMDALYPYFAGASLGWHDYLASTARLFKNDANYRIPVKADPNIVIKYIKASHNLLAEAVGSRGGIKVGGMYGILPAQGHDSLQITLKGYLKDVITQMKRNLTGFWVAHPDFVRLGLALVEAWKQKIAGDGSKLTSLVTSLLDEKYHKEILGFISGPDIEGLDTDNPSYVRSLIVADIKESDFIPNNHPDEIRYNVFQSLQYLTDWLSGNGCVALPTIIDGIPVRVMDDLATAERSRWEVWAELAHGRFSLEEFICIAHEEMNFIRRDLSNGKKIVQVKWDERTARWYPISMRIMLQLMTAERPVEFATELLMPFTVDAIRSAQDPWAKANELDPGKFALPEYVQRFEHYFEICGSERFAEDMALLVAEDFGEAERIVRSFSLAEILAAASFHGDIGQSKKTLDAKAAAEQAQALAGEESVQEELRALGETYCKKFGFKFLISAQGKSAKELLESLATRVNNSPDQEQENARSALWEITRKRMTAQPLNQLKEKIESLRVKYGIMGAGVALNFHGNTQSLSYGESKKGIPVTKETRFEIASLSKTFAAALALEAFRELNIPLATPVNELFARAKSPFRLSSPHKNWAEQVTLEHLLGHSALNMHYVKGLPPTREMPDLLELMDGKHGYEKIKILAEPGKEFHYSGGGFLVVEHLLKSLGVNTSELFGLENTTFHYSSPSATGYLDSGDEVPGGRLHFPGFTAGAFGTASDIAHFLRNLSEAYHELDGGEGISHDTAVRMLHGSDKGCRAFMGCEMGLGVFVAEAGPNKFALHQGANEGFRALYLHCFFGPDQGKGLVILANGDNRAVPFIAEAAQEILRTLRIQGIDFTKFQEKFSPQNLKQEEIVNLGYKTLLFDAFLPTLPAEIPEKGPPDPLASRNILVGAKILSCTNQKFARAENLISPHLPLFNPELFCDQGKVMDSWESARHNPLGKETLVLELRKPSSIRYASLSTKFHDGNQAEFVALFGLSHGTWREILPKTPLQGHSLLRFDLGLNTTVYDQIRVEMFPDGGFSRLGLYQDLPESEARNFSPGAKSLRFDEAIPKTRKPLTIPYTFSAEEKRKNFHSGAEIDFASQAFGAKLVSASNEHYGPAAQVISPYPPIHMFDGMESSRSRDPGHHEEVVIELAAPTQIGRVELDYTFFVNNNPLYVSLHGLSGNKWIELVPKTKAKAFAGNRQEFHFPHAEIFTAVQVKTYPDGGINRIRIFA